MATDRIDLLTNVSETVRKHVNENIARYNPSKAEDLGLTYGHIHKAADTICRIYQDLHTIIDDATVVPPSVADSSPYFAWEFLFTEAWVTHDKAHDIAQRRLDEWQRPGWLTSAPPASSTSTPTAPTPSTSKTSSNNADTDPSTPFPPIRRRSNVGFGADAQQTPSPSPTSSSLKSEHGAYPRASSSTATFLHS